MIELPTPTDIEVMALRADLTMSEVCQIAGVSHATFSKWKKHRAKIRFETVQKLLDAIKKHNKDAAE